MLTAAVNIRFPASAHLRIRAHLAEWRAGGMAAHDLSIITHISVGAAHGDGAYRRARSRTGGTRRARGSGARSARTRSGHRAARRALAVGRRRALRRALWPQ